MAKNPVLQGRTKHIEKACHLIRDHIKKGKISLEYVRSQQQVTDIFTKPLNKVQFQEMRCHLRLLTQGEFEMQNSFPDLGK